MGTSREAPTGSRVELTIDAAGQVSWDDVRLSAPMLEAQLAFAARQNPQPTLVLHAAGTQSPLARAPERRTKPLLRLI